jgi:hypothetical protein
MITESEIIAGAKYAGAAILGSGIVSGFIKWMWGAAISDFKNLLKESHDSIIGELNNVKATQQIHAKDIAEIKESLREGGFRFDRIEEDMNKTQTNLLDKIGGVTEKANEYREKNREIFVTRLEIEGEIVKACAKHCKGHRQ